MVEDTAKWVAAAIAVGGTLLAGGRMTQKIDENREWLIRVDAHLLATDIRVANLEQREAGLVAVLDAVLDKERNAMRVPFENVPTSPPPTSPNLRKQH